MKRLDLLKKKLDVILSCFLVLLLAIMVGVVFLQVVVRSLKGSLPWSEELSRYLQIYLTLWGIVLLVEKEALISVDSLFSRVNKKMKRWIQTFVYLVLAILSLFLIYSSFGLVTLTMEQTSPVLKIPMGLVYFAVLSSSIFVFFYNMLHWIYFRREEK